MAEQYIGDQTIKKRSQRVRKNHFSRFDTLNNTPLGNFPILQDPRIVNISVMYQEPVKNASHISFYTRTRFICHISTTA